MAGMAIPPERFSPKAWRCSERARCPAASYFYPSANSGELPKLQIPCSVCTACVHYRPMRELRFDWDPKKAALNERKHGVSFEDAQTVFSDERARLIDDPDHSESEERFVLLGLSSSLRLLVVVHCFRAESNTIRIISARKATQREAIFYP